MSPILPSILVVDRARGQSAVVQALLQHFRTVVVGTRDEAIETARGALPDVIVADAVIDGQEAAQWAAEIRRDPVLSTVPLVLVNAPQADVSIAVRALDAGADDCLTGPIAPELLIAKMRALLARRAAEVVEMRTRLEEQRLDLSQKEAIGRLAGGVAHNFNNLLTVILVSSEMLMAQLPRDTPEWQQAHESFEAGTRAAALTSQLLAFSGRQLLRPAEVDLNRMLADLTPLLQSVVGEHVELKISPDADLPLVRVDPSQIRRVIVDLATHARAAMAGGGTMIVETDRVVLTEAYVARHVNVQPGVYVRLAISDTGAGMDPDTQLHLFEPFFRQHEAAGFGLAPVYGIVRQSGGHIWVYSEPGHGTTFKIYLPEAARAPRADTLASRARPLPGGGASVLLVEDDSSVRAAARRVLEGLGYTVVTASSGEEALERCADPGLAPDLLITDVVMPGISGSQLVARLRSDRHGLRVLYTSGFTEDAVVHHGVAAGEHFLSKPFTPTDLAYKVREVLGSDPDPTRV